MTNLNSFLTLYLVQSKICHSMSSIDFEIVNNQLTCLEWVFLAGNQDNHQNFDQSLLHKKTWLIFMGMKKKTGFLWEKKPYWLTQRKTEFFKNSNSQYFLRNFRDWFSSAIGYRTRAIITRGLYYFYPIFSFSLRFVLQTIYVLKTKILHFLSLKSGVYIRERFLIKSGL